MIQITTANARMASTRCPATGRSAGSGNNNTTTSASTPINKPMGSPNLGLVIEGGLPVWLMHASLPLKIRQALYLAACH